MKKKTAGLTLLELLGAVLLTSLLVSLAWPAVWRIWQSQARRLKEIETWIDLTNAVDKIGRELQSSGGLISSLSHPLDDWHLSFSHPEGDRTYYIEGQTLKRKINSAQSLTAERAVLNQLASPALPPYSYSGGLITIRFVVDNQGAGQLLTASFFMRNATED